VGSTGRDRNRVGENMNSPTLQEKVGQSAAFQIATGGTRGAP